MKKRKLAALLLAAALLLTTPALAQEGDPPPDGAPETTADTPETPVSPEEALPTPTGLTLRTDEHFAYITGSGSSFHPDDSISRAEAAQILCRLMEHPVPILAAYTDVPADAWYAPAAGMIGSLGVMGEAQGQFRPGEPITRGELIHAVAGFFPARPFETQFTDVSPQDPYAADYLTARALGWVSGFQDGSLRPEEPITRAQAVTLLNRALGRTPDRAYIDGTNPLLYRDVPPGSWCFYDVMEASIPHQHTLSGGTEVWTGHTPVSTNRDTGFCLSDGWLYYFDRDSGNVLRNTSHGSFTFDASGHFTSGNPDLDARLREIVLAETNGGMTQEQKLRALYVYTRDSFTYLRRPPYDFGVTDFMEKDALDMLSTGYGNCYSYASVFWYLARWVGYDARIYSGTVGTNKRPHSWVEIDFDGKSYIFDTELEMAYHKKGRHEINLYKYIDVDGWVYIK